MSQKLSLSGAALGLAITVAVAASEPPVIAPALPKIRVAADGRSFETSAGQPFVPLGVTYYRPGTGWAPQVWKKFDAEATRQDFARMKEAGVNCARVFLTYGSFYERPGVLKEEGLARLDAFLRIAEAAGIYVHPTGPDHWEGTPDWARADRYADDTALNAIEDFWKLLAARYAGRNVIFAYDLLNEPEMRWDSAAMRSKWNRWLKEKYSNEANIKSAWKVEAVQGFPDQVAVPAAQEAPGNLRLLDYQRFRETLADEWTRRQAQAIKRVDPQVLVTVGLIQWSVPVLLPGLQHYAAFRPERQARHLDFLTVHFYPLEHGAYEYKDAESELRNLAYLEAVVRAVAQPGKPVVVGEFGWYGGGKPGFDGGQHPAASEEQQARWCRRAVETTAGFATGWLNWGFYDQPEARDVSELTGLFTSTGKVKAWGEEFKKLSQKYRGRPMAPMPAVDRPPLDWDLCVTSQAAANQYREACLKAFKNQEAGR